MLPIIWGYEVRRSGAAVYPIADPEKAFLDTLYLALIPRSRIGFPRKRTRRWPLDRRRLAEDAARFAFAPLSRWLRGQGPV